MREETGTKVSISTVKRVLSKEKATAPNPPLKKARLRFATAHGDKIVVFGEMSSDLMKQK